MTFLLDTDTCELRKQGNLLEDFDILLAATAQLHALTLVTGNRDLFGRIAGLVLEN